MPPVFSFQSDPLPTNPSTIPSHQKATRPNLSRLKTIGVSNVAIRSYQPLSGYQSSDSPTPSDLSSPQVPLSAVSVVSSPVKRQATVTENVRPRRRAKSIDANSMSMGGIMRRKTTRVMRREMEFESLVINELQEPIPDVHNQIEDNSQRGSSNNRQSLASNSSSGVPKSKSSADVFTFSNITTNVMSFSTMMSNVSRVGYQQATSVSSALHSALASPTNLQNFLPFSKFGRSASRETLHSLGAQSQLPEIQRSKESLVTTNTTTNSSLIPQILTSSDISSELQSPIGHQQPFTIPFERATSFLSGPLTDAMNFWKQKLDEQTERLRQWTLESQNRVQEKQTQLDSEKEKMESVMSQVAQRSVTTKSRTLKVGKHSSTLCFHMSYVALLRGTGLMTGECVRESCDGRSCHYSIIMSTFQIVIPFTFISSFFIHELISWYKNILTQSSNPSSLYYNPSHSFTYPKLFVMNALITHY